MTWADLFDRAPDGITEDDVRRTLAEHRAGDGPHDGEPAGDGRAESGQQGADR